MIISGENFKTKRLYLSVTKRLSCLKTTEQKKPRYQAVSQTLGKLWDVSEDHFLRLEEFTHSMLKPRGSHLSVDNLHYEMILKYCCGNEN